VTDAPSVWRIGCARIAAAALIVALAPLPLAAAEPTPTSPAIDFKAAVRKYVAAERRTSTMAAPAQAAKPVDTAALQSPSFFKTPLGLAVIAVVGGGAAYALYSTQHDRIHSQVR
jgi:hypothetical protein